MQVAIYARVSTLNQQQEGTIASQIQLLRQHVQQQGWALLPEHEYIDDGVSGGRLDRPASTGCATVRNAVNSTLSLSSRLTGSRARMPISGCSSRSSGSSIRR